MAGVDVWFGVVVNAVAVIGALAATMTWLIRRLDVRIDSRIASSESRLGQRIDGVEAKLAQRIDGLESRIDNVEARLGERIEGVESSLSAKVESAEARLSQKIDGLREVTDVRLRALETDTTIIKQHLLGQTAA